VSKLVGVHRLWLQLHLKLFAALPKSLDSLFEGHGVLRIPVHMLALKKVGRNN
jgi:hypothetical protein